MSLKILSLLPAATEMVYLLGLEENLVGVSHDCDYPTDVKRIAKVTSTVIDQNFSSEKIDTIVRKSKHQGSSIFHINETLLKELSPNFILTQELCSVCAVSYTEIKKAAKILSGQDTLLSLEPESIQDIFENIRTIGEYTRKKNEADRQIKKLQKRLDKVGKKTKQTTRPSVLVIEWLAPLMVAGHWIPEMLTSIHAKNLITKVGEKSVPISWASVVKLNPDYIILAPCGFDIKRTKNEIHLMTQQPEFFNLKAYQEKNIFLVDGNAYLTRPGPRVVDGVEIFSELLYPTLFPRKHTRDAWQRL